MSDKNTCRCLSGVCCDVSSCRYHDCSNNKCTASSIKVECPTSCCKSDTYCSTYQAK